MQPVEPPILMWVTDRRRSDAELSDLARSAVAGGVDVIQVREKGLDRSSLAATVQAVRAAAGTSIDLVVNTDIELAQALGVGVHLPESGPTIAEARAVLGHDALVGRSVHSPDAATASEGASYLVAGHVFETASKPGRSPLGLDRFAEIVAVAPAPVIAIGGITPERVRAVMEAGAVGVAVLGPLTRLATIGSEAAAYHSALEACMSRAENRSISATINGKEVTLPAGTTVADFLAGRELHERLVVVERNGEIIKRSTFPEVVIEEGDLLEVVHFVGGG